MNWIIGIALLVVIGYLLDREIWFYEGVHLGPRVQAWLYDRWSRKYDVGKRESQLRDDEMLAQPLLDALQDVPEPFILDFAAGTGRLSCALARQPDFKGRIVALDLSLGMLEQAAAKLSRASSSFATPLTPLPFARVEFLRHTSLPLLFPDAAFDAVCALEVLELFPDMDAPLAEFARVLRPGGTLLASRGAEESGRRAKVKSAPAFTSLLERNGFENIRITKWWRLFDRVLAVKSGESNPVVKRGLQDALKCPGCGSIRWEGDTNALRCGICRRELSVTKDGIVMG